MYVLKDVLCDFTSGIKSRNRKMLPNIILATNNNFRFFKADTDLKVKKQK
jgi:hypothetical protein